MPALKIFVADDQIPPADITETEFRAQVLTEFGDSPQNRIFPPRASP